MRGHSNVQGNRTCGIDHRPAAEFLDRLQEVCGSWGGRKRLVAVLSGGRAWGERVVLVQWRTGKRAMWTNEDMMMLWVMVETRVAAP